MDEIARRGLGVLPLMFDLHPYLARHTPEPGKRSKKGKKNERKKTAILDYRSTGGRSRRLLRLRRWLQQQLGDRRRFHLCRDAGQRFDAGWRRKRPRQFDAGMAQTAQQLAEETLPEIIGAECKMAQLVDFQEEDFPLPWEHGLGAGGIVVLPGESEMTWQHGNYVSSGRRGMHAS